MRQKEKSAALYQKFLVCLLPLLHDLRRLFLLFLLPCLWLARTYRRTPVFPSTDLGSNLCLLAKIQDLLEWADLMLKVRAVLRLLQLHFVPRLFAQRKETAFIHFLLYDSSCVGVERGNGLGAQRSLLRDVGRWQGRGRLWRDRTGGRNTECSGEALFWERYRLVRFGPLRSRGAR